MRYSVVKTEEFSTITLPEKTVESLRRLAVEQNQTVEQWIQSMILRQERQAGFRRLLAYGKERGRASGYKEEDVVGLIKEIRKEMAEERAALATEPKSLSRGTGV